MKKALITGITGQDGYFLSQLLLEKGYEVHGLVRRNSQKTLGTLSLLENEVLSKINIKWGDITDNSYINQIVAKEQYNEIYHLAAQSFVALSFENPNSTYDININGTLNIVNAVKDFSPNSKVYFAATSELFGKIQEKTQNENTPFYPRSPYAISKLAAFWTIKNYREGYDLFMSNGILFNHESEVRGIEFVTRKITKTVANIYLGSKTPLEIGNMDAKRDWGYAKDYVVGMWKILQHNKPDDFVLATGKTFTVRKLIKEAFSNININIKWEGKGINEIGRNSENNEILVKVNPKFFRPTEVECLIGDNSKAKEKLNWSPSVQFKELVKIMVNNDIKIQKNILIKLNG